MSHDSARDQLAAIVYRVNNPKHGDYGSHEVTADAILAAGWQPPLPDSETELTSVSEIAGFLSTIMNTEKARSAAEFLDRGYHLTRREVTS